VSTRATEMSMSVRCAGCGLQYAGQRGPGGLAAGLRRGGGRYLRLLADVPRFHRAARQLLAGQPAGGKRGAAPDRGTACREFTTHPDQALALLAPATQAERDLLGAFRYTPNPALLHTDARLLPEHPAVRASWNYQLAHRQAGRAGPTRHGGAVRISYHMNRLQGLPAGQDYMAGDWDCADLTELLTVFAAHVGDLVPPWLQRMRSLAVRRSPAGDRQTRDGARRNIGRHYDLSNELFALFLDETMTYSSALFATDHDGTPLAADHLLADAQRRKIDRLLDRAGVGPGCRLLEVGTGWGEQPHPPDPAADHGPRRLRPALRGNPEDLARPVRRPRGGGKTARLRQGVQPHVEVLPVLLRGRLSVRPHRRQPAHPGPHMKTNAADVIADLVNTADR